MIEKVAEIAERIKEIRQIEEISAEEISEKIAIPLEDYLKYENAELDIPVSFIYAVAGVFKVDPTELMTGEAPRMTSYTITRKGKGISIERYKEYSFSALAFNFKNRDMDPMIVDLLPNGKIPKFVTHTGQEFNYVLQGQVTILFGDKKFELNEGDSIYFDPSVPHGQIAEKGPASFLTVINE